MDGDDPLSQQAGIGGDFHNLSRRDSKRRRLDDQAQSDPQWSGTQHEPDFVGVTLSKPDRMTDDIRLSPEQNQSVWQSQYQGEALAYDPLQSYSDNDQPYFYSQQGTPAYTQQSWSDVSLQGPYNVRPSPFSTLTPIRDYTEPFSFESSTQYLDTTRDLVTTFDASTAIQPDDGAFSTFSTSFDVPYGQPFMTDLNTMQLAFPETQSSIAPNLAHLERLAVQVIQIVAKVNHTEFQELLQGSTVISRRFLTTKNAFDQAHALLCSEQAFIDAPEVKGYSTFQQDAARRINTATFILSVMGAQNVSFSQLDQAFLNVFVPIGHRLLKWQGAIYLELKTQTYILSVLNNDSNMINSLLDELFPADLDAHILSRHPDAPSLSPSEHDFVDRCKARRHYLLVESHTDELRNELPTRYQWAEFVKEFSNCISKNVDHILSPSHRQAAIHGALNRRRAGSGPIVHNQTSGEPNVRRSISNGGDGAHSLSAHEKKGAVTAHGHAVRQAWTKSEEEALIAGLEQVGGPHWSQILALYGRGGSISEVLKDRNQVQLKDKARNLKLWYLKMGHAVPAPLRGVTGELRKRGGARARATLEAEEQSAAFSSRERRSSDEADLGDGADLDTGVKSRHDTVDPDADNPSMTKC